MSEMSDESDEQHEEEAVDEPQASEEAPNSAEKDGLQSEPSDTPEAIDEPAVASTVTGKVASDTPSAAKAAYTPSYVFLVVVTLVNLVADL